MVKSIAKKSKAKKSTNTKNVLSGRVHKLSLKKGKRGGRMKKSSKKSSPKKKSARYIIK